MNLQTDDGDREAASEVRAIKCTILCHETCMRGIYVHELQVVQRYQGYPSHAASLPVK